MKRFKGVCIGAGYFSQFHGDAWNRIPDANIVAVCDKEKQKASAFSQKFGIAKTYTDYIQMLDEEKPDFIDIITPPASHLSICREAAARGITIICQKPLAPSMHEAQEIVDVAASSGVRIMVHDNFRFQPWHQEIKRLVDLGTIGDRLHSLYFRSRQGDGWGEDAYLNRQPYFRDMPRLLIHETGIHFIDVFCLMAGEVDKVHALLRKLNPVIRGEDSGLLIFEFSSGAIGTCDANRYNESTAENPRYTFGEFLVEGNGGSIRLYADGKMSVQKLGQTEHEHVYKHEKKGFAGDCVYFTQRHFIDCLRDARPFATDIRSYMENIKIEEALYYSAQYQTPVKLKDFVPM
ncbi:Gfo/Idh/MocA family oxidoreductase [candidate division KSB1 bacterium]|nr:Gfo/Idh/MocA family oxidoreductase [candidate division KSB1 bacterium]